MVNNCPGQDSRWLTAALYKCPQCGYMVEMFSDELKGRCPKCKTMVYKENAPSCIQWCKSAKECLGEARFNEMMEQIKGGEHR
ncbi:MAG: phosphohydrolase [Candidatus Desantisbacteria bacterium]